MKGPGVGPRLLSKCLCAFKMSLIKCTCVCSLMFVSLWCLSSVLKPQLMTVFKGAVSQFRSFNTSQALKLQNVPLSMSVLLVWTFLCKRLIQRHLDLHHLIHLHQSFGNKSRNNWNKSSCPKLFIRVFSDKPPQWDIAVAHSWFKRNKHWFIVEVEMQVLVSSVKVTHFVHQPSTRTSSPGGFAVVERLSTSFHTLPLGKSLYTWPQVVLVRSQWTYQL